MTDDLDKAILMVKEVVIPRVDLPHIPDKPYKGLYNILQLFDVVDEQTDKQVEFIYNFLEENGGNPRDQIASIHSKLGALNRDSLVSRVHKYCRLKEQANKALTRYENLQKDINAIGHSR